MVRDVKFESFPDFMARFCEVESSIKVCVLSKCRVTQLSSELTAVRIAGEQGHGSRLYGV